MSMIHAIDDTIFLPDAPAIPGLTFRHFRGEVDYQAMVDIINGSKAADGLEWTAVVDDTARLYAHLVNCDPYRDMIFAEIDGKVLGYGRVWWEQQLDGTRLYGHFVHLLPEWRNKGLRRAILRHNEHRLRQIAAAHPLDGSRFFSCGAADTEKHWETLLISEGYQAVRHGFTMVRPNLDNIPDLPLPEGLGVRTADLGQWPAIWEAAREAFRDHWGQVEWTEEGRTEWQQSPTFDPSLWQVAWDGDEVAGMVLNFINQAENEEYGRRRGYTETICVRRPWRKRGLARALIARSFRVLKAQGMTEAALGVDAENLSGALRLYESMGFQVVKRYSTYRKPVDGVQSVVE